LAPDSRPTLLQSCGQRRSGYAASSLAGIRRVVMSGDPSGVDGFEVIRLTRRCPEGPLAASALEGWKLRAESKNPAPADHKSADQLSERRSGSELHQTGTLGSSSVLTRQVFPVAANERSDGQPPVCHGSLSTQFTLYTDDPLGRSAVTYVPFPKRPGGSGVGPQSHRPRRNGANVAGRGTLAAKNLLRRNGAASEAADQVHRR
jgi:hypothetical protein